MAAIAMAGFSHVWAMRALTAMKNALDYPLSVRSIKPPEVIRDQHALAANGRYLLNYGAHSSISKVGKVGLSVRLFADRAALEKLPVGIQTFREIIEEKYVYVDKTEHLHTLLNKGKVYFFARPRRFGKSLILSTLQEIFAGYRKLFENLYLSTTDYHWKKYPVLMLNFSAIDYENPDALKRGLKWELENIAKMNNLVLSETPSISACLKNLVMQLSKTGKVAVLIDEYDAPLVNNLKDPAIADACRDILRPFYATLKALDQYISFIFVTGIAQFSLTGFFSGLKNLRDLTLSRDGALLVGFTRAELLRNFISLNALNRMLLCVTWHFLCLKTYNIR